MRRHFVMKGIAFLILAPAFVAAVSLVVMLLWNALIPALFAGPLLTFWQAAGLLVLCRILFGGLRGHAGQHGWRRAAWRDRWNRMTPQERERFREGFRRWKDMSWEERREFRRGIGGGGFGVCGGPMPDEFIEPRGAPHEGT